MKFAFVGLEGVNQKMGPILKMKGWSNTMVNDMDQFERPLRTIYRRHFARKQGNPFVQIGLTIVFSIVVFHFQEFGAKIVGQTGVGGDNASASAKGGDDDIEPPPAEKGSRDFNRAGGGGGLNIGTLGNIFKMFANVQK